MRPPPTRLTSTPNPTARFAAAAARLPRWHRGRSAGLRPVDALALIGLTWVLGCDADPNRCANGPAPDLDGPDAGSDDSSTDAGDPDDPSPAGDPVPDLPGPDQPDDEPSPPNLGATPAPDPDLYCAPWIEGSAPQTAVHRPVTADTDQWGGVIVNGLADGTTAELKLDVTADLRAQLHLYFDGALVVVVEHRPVEYIEAAATEDAAVVVWTSPTLETRGDQLAAVLGHEVAHAMFGGLFGDATQTCAMVDTPVMRASERVWAAYAAAGAAACCQDATVCRPCTGNAAAAVDAARAALRDSC